MYEPCSANRHLDGCMGLAKCALFLLKGGERRAEGVEIHALCSSLGVLGQSGCRERQVQLNRSFSAETDDFGQL
jgi:hypothetical protein